MSPGDLIAISVQHRDGVVVLAVEGEIDIATAPVLDAAVADALAEKPAALVIDLSAVTFLASAGLRILVQTTEQLSGRACFGVVASGAATTRPIQLMRLDSMFALHETLDAALAVVSTDTDNRG